MNLQSKKLAGYSSMAAVYLLMQKADGQIYYTDIDPDTMLQFSGDIYDLDIDGNGFTNFHFFKSSTYSSSSWWAGEVASMQRITVWGIGGNNSLAGSYMLTGFCESCSSSFINPYAFNPGIIINSFYDFYAGSIMAEVFESYFVGGDAGNWHPVKVDKYLGVRFEDDDGENHYGWIRCDVLSDYRLVIKDFAYDGFPDAPIITGDMGGCWTPVPLGTGSITSSSAKPKWDAVPSADYYQLQFRPEGVLSWTNKMVEYPKTFKKLNALTCSTNYEWRIRAICTDGTTTPYSSIQTFTTSVCKLENENAINEENISIWSNANQIHIGIDEDISEPVHLILFDETGRNVFSNQLSEPENTFELNLPNGIYIAAIYSGERMFSKKIVMQN